MKNVSTMLYIRLTSWLTIVGIAIALIALDTGIDSNKSRLPALIVMLLP